MSLGEFEVAEDMCLDGLKIVQDTRLYRFTSDSVLLSRFARAKNGDEVADFCAGSGIVAFHFYALHREKKKNLRFTLVEMQAELAALAKKTVEINSFEPALFTVENRKIQDLPAEYTGKFSLILCNPPYETGGFENDDYQKAVCRKELTVNLAEIACAASKCLKYGGRLALVNRADRAAELVYTLKERGIEVKRLQFVAGKAEAKPYLVLVEGVKGGKAGVEVLPTLVNQR